MILHDFECENCGHVWEHLGTPYLCPKCGSVYVKRVFLKAPFKGKEPFQSAAIMADGSKVKGHWGKLAPRKKRTK